MGSSLESAGQVVESLTDDTRYEMKDWQADDIAMLADRRYSANWSEMGTYKTSTGLWLIDRVCKEYLRATKRMPRVLIISSKGGKGTYFDAVPKCLPDWRLYNLTVRTAAERVGNVEFEVELEDLLKDLQMGYFNHPSIVLAHYDCFTNRANRANGLVDRLRKVPWTFVLADEAHKLKNRDTQWTRNIKRLRSMYRHLMTGTGFVNRPDEIWSLLNFLDKDTWGGYWSFRRHFCIEVKVSGFWQVVGTKLHRIEEFRELRQELGPRRMMADVHAGIGHPIYSHREVELNKVQRRMYNEIKNVLRTLDHAGTSITSPNVLSQLTRLRQISVATPLVEHSAFDPLSQRMVTEIRLTEPSSKLDECMDILKELDWENGHKPQAVVFSCFSDPLKLLAMRLQEADIPYLHMLQKHSDQERYEMWHDLLPQKKHKVFMSTLSLGGESINLSSAQYLIFLDRSWSPKDMMQAVGRVYRPGQVHVPEIIHINAKNTVDTYVKQRLDRKAKWFDEIFGEK